MRFVERTCPGGIYSLEVKLVTSKPRNILTAIGIAAGFLYLFLCPQQASAAITDGLNLCAHTIVPSMFPYFVLSGLFISLGCADKLGRRLSGVMSKLFSVSGRGAAPLLLGLVGGYPLGAKTVADLYTQNQLTKEEAEKLLFFCCNAGPAFIIGVVGGALYRSAAAGLALYLIHIVSALLCGILPFSKPAKPASVSQKSKSAQPLPFSSALVHAVDSALHTALKVCSFILLFSLLTGVEKQLLPSSILSVVLSGLTELSTGCAALAAENVSWQLKFSLTSAFLAFGGVCVLCQTLSVISESRLPIKPYFLGKVLQALLSAVMAYPISYFLKSAVPTAGIPISLQPLSPFPWNFLPFALLLLIFLQLPPRNSSRCAL